jgi:hypothetical protein
MLLLNSHDCVFRASFTLHISLYLVNKKQWYHITTFGSFVILQLETFHLNAVTDCGGIRLFSQLWDYVISNTRVSDR